MRWSCRHGGFAESSRALCGNQLVWVPLSRLQPVRREPEQRRPIWRPVGWVKRAGRQAMTRSQLPSDRQPCASANWLTPPQ